MSLVIAVDLDEVLGEFVATLARYHNEVYGTNLSVADFHSYDFVDVWGGTREEANAKVLDFFESSHFKDELPPIPEALSTLRELKATHQGAVDFHLVTSRQHIIRRETEEWIALHFPQVFTDLHFGNHYSETGPSRSKGEMCEAIGAALLIDDSLKYALQVAGDSKIEVLLFGDYPWNRLSAGASLPALVSRVTSWSSVKLRIEELLKAEESKKNGNSQESSG